MEKVTRTCATCACSMIQNNPADPNHKQLFCRLNPPDFQVVTIEVPRMKDGAPIMSPREPNKPLTDKVQQPVYIYPPVFAELTCFGGWRPIGTEPGSKSSIQEDIGVIMGAMEPILNALGIFKAPLDG